MTGRYARSFSAYFWVSVWSTRVKPVLCLCKTEGQNMGKYGIKVSVTKFPQKNPFEFIGNCLKSAQQFEPCIHTVSLFAIRTQGYLFIYPTQGRSRVGNNKQIKQMNVFVLLAALPAPLFSVSSLASHRTFPPGIWVCAACRFDRWQSGLHHNRR